LPALLYCTVLQAALLPWTLLSCVGELWQGKIELLAGALLGLVLVIATELFCLAVSLYFSIQARKPTEGSAKGLLTCGVIDVILLVLYYTVLKLDDFLGLLIFVACAHLAMAFAAWQMSLFALQRQRHGDVAVAGKATG
jgi:hypothetical protein